MASRICLLIAALLCAAPCAEAQPRDAFYAGKTISILVGFTPGGFYDITSRVVARHIGRFIPGNPNTIVQNQPGAGGATMANRLARTIERNGLTIASINRALPQLALVGDPSAQFDPLELTWIGSISSYKDDAYLMTISAAHPARSVADLKPSAPPLNLGATALGSTNGIFAGLSRDLLGLNIKVIGGFPGAQDIWIGMDRGEIDGQLVDISAILVARPQLWKEGKLRPLLAFGRTARLPDHPQVPIGRELIKGADDLALLAFAELPFFMASPFAAPPDLPTERAQLLKAAFMEMSRDEAFKADMAKAGLLISPIDGNAVHALIAEAAKTPADVRKRFAKLLGST